MSHGPQPRHARKCGLGLDMSMPSVALPACPGGNPPKTTRAFRVGGREKRAQKNVGDPRV
jgi:hypothetical protein